QDHAERVHAGDEIVLIGLGDGEALGRITGRFVDAAEIVPHGTRIEAIALPELEGVRRLVAIHPVTVVEGELALEELPPGRYRVLVLGGQSELARSDWIAVEAGRTSEVGVLASEPGGTVVVMLENAASVALADVELGLLAADDDYQSLVPE